MSTSVGAFSPAATSRLVWLAALLVALPWLLPFAPGPSPNAIPLMFSWGAAVLLALLVSWSRRDALFAAVLVAALAAAVVLAGPQQSAAAAIAAVLASLISMAAVTRLDARQAADAVSLGWLAAGLVSSGLALVQYFGAASALHPFAAAAQLGEAYANLRQRNQFATLCSLALVGALWLSSRPSCFHSARRLLALAILIIAAGNAASASRTGFVQWLCLVGVAACWRRWDWFRWALGATGAYLVLVGVLPAVLRYFWHTEVPDLFSRMSSGPSCGTRSVLWPNVLELTGVHPWRGWGWGELDFAHYAHLYGGERFCDILDNAHNGVLHIAVELGWVAALLVVLAIAAAVMRLRPWTETVTQRQLGWLAVLVVTLHSLVEYPLWYGPFQIALGVAIGLLRTPQPAAGARGAPLAPLLLASGVLILLCYVAWDYRRISQLYLPAEQRASRYRDQTLEEARKTWFFRDQVRFAELSTTALTRDNADQMHALAVDMLHFSPEPRVIALVIESALALGRDDVAAWHAARFKAAFPEDYDRWAEERGVLKNNKNQ